MSFNQIAYKGCCSSNASFTLPKLYINDRWNKYIGKGRDVYFANKYNYALINHSDRVSCHDSQITNIKNKGIILNYLNVWWMNQTKHIIDNHYLYHNQTFLLAKKCKRINVEVVVRAYITGSTSTSLWTLYQQDNEGVYGLELPKGLKKNQKLPTLLITPTSKGDSGEPDKPLTDDQIVDEGYIGREEWEYIKLKALELFEYGSMVSESRGLILVDTKYEFGYDDNNNIILIDEIHTGDSSRFWGLESYDNKFYSGAEPICFDKDHIRRYISEVDPNFKTTPIKDRKKHQIPENIKNNLFESYDTLYNQLTKESLNDIYNIEHRLDMKQFLELFHDNIAPLAVILAGSKGDEDKVKKVEYQLYSHKISYNTHYHSAHKETETVMNLIKHYNNFYGKRKIVFITVVGLSNALGGVLAANTKFPVINCPNFKDNIDMLININSSLQMPSNVPSAVVLREDNVAQFVRNILGL
jgi:phosphoribosylaminoimidazole-succinocarboxamide synthase